MTPPSTNTVYVVTGANRGIGLGLFKSLLARPSTTVIGTVRTSDARAFLIADMAGVMLGHQSSFEVVQLDLSTAPDPQKVRSLFAVPHVDVLINNAAVSPPMKRAVETSTDELRFAFEINTIAPLAFFQGLWPLMKLSPSPAGPKLIMMTSSVGSISLQEVPAGGAYGPSKAALNWLACTLHHQHEADKLVSVALHPGWVQTRMGIFSATEWNYAAGPPQTLDDSVQGILKIIDGATRETFSGKFVSFTGEEILW